MFKMFIPKRENISKINKAVIIKFLLIVIPPSIPDVFSLGEACANDVSIIIYISNIFLLVRLHLTINLLVYNKMGLFSFVETFFFVSLGITFILILLLVYHFRQRFITLEQKCDTMFELINNIVMELNNGNRVERGIIQSDPNILFYPAPEGHAPVNTDIEEMNDSDVEDDSEDEDSGDESDDEESSEASSDDEESEYDVQDAGDENSVKVILFDQPDMVEISEIPNDTNEVSDNENENDVATELLQTDARVVVEKLEDKHLENNEQTNQEDNANEVYRKMNIQALKALVITKGLCSDPSKMKKTELVKMLETNDHM
jgi:hypothetical protein